MHVSLKNVSIKCYKVSKKRDGTSTFEESGRFYGTGSFGVKSSSGKVGLQEFGKDIGMKGKMRGQGPEEEGDVQRHLAGDPVGLSWVGATRYAGS